MKPCCTTPPTDNYGWRVVHGLIAYGNLAFALTAFISACFTSNWLDLCIGFFCLTAFTRWLEDGR